MSELMGLAARLRARLRSWPDGMLSVALLAVAVVIILIALSRGHPWLKAAALAYTILP